MSLLLRRIQSLRQWDNPDDYLVQYEGQTVGRIFQGHTADLESAMAAFRESWDRGRSSA